MKGNEMKIKTLYNMMLTLETLKKLFNDFNKNE